MASASSIANSFGIWLRKEFGTEAAAILQKNGLSSKEEVLKLKNGQMEEINLPQAVRRKIRHQKLIANFEDVKDETSPLEGCTKKETVCLDFKATGCMMERRKTSNCPLSLVHLEVVPTLDRMLRRKAVVSVRLALEMKEKSRLLPSVDDTCMSVYQLPVKELLSNAEKRISVKEVELYHITKPPTIVIMLVGASGAGKTSLINTIANHFYGVRWEDAFRFKLISEEGQDSQIHSQTSWITAYTFRWNPDSCLQYSLTIIDTPGFGDTKGMNADKAIVEQIKEFFSTSSKHGIYHLHGVAFVAQASLIRLTAEQKYIFESVLSVFGKDISNNIFLMATFADGQKPCILEAAREAGVPYQRYFTFNNSAIFADNADSDSIDEMYWKMALKSFNSFFDHLQIIEPSSLYLTRDVLKEREKLSDILKKIHFELQQALIRTSELEQEKKVMKKHLAAIRANEDFTATVQITRQRKCDLQVGTHVTNCLMCSFTCHLPCTVNLDEKKNECSVISNQHCTVCPQRCHWSKHFNNPFYFEVYTETVTRTLDDLKEKYADATSGKCVAETMLARLDKELEELHKEVLQTIRMAKQSMQSLEEIALKPNPLSEAEYIDVLIESEKQQRKPGWLERVKTLLDFKEKLTVLINVSKVGISENKMTATSAMDGILWQELLQPQ